MTDLHGPDDRGAERLAFLKRAGVTYREIEALPSDASPRKYFRLYGAKRLLMQEVPGAPDFALYVKIAGHLNNLGLSAPRVFETDDARCLAVIEDFGDQTYTKAFRDGADVVALYELAVDTLLDLHSKPEAVGIDLPHYDLQVLLEELTRFTDWYAPYRRRDLDQRRFRSAFLELWGPELEEVGKRVDALVLRDFHVDNLMILAERPSTKACGLLDFQDALLGAPEYDLLSILQDARRDLPVGLEARLLDRYLAGRADVDRDDFLRNYWLLGAQRHARIAGVFIRLWKRDGKDGYLQYMPRVLGQLDHALTQAKLSNVRDLLDSTLTAWADWPGAAAPKRSANV